MGVILLFANRCSICIVMYSYISIYFTGRSTWKYICWRYCTQTSIFCSWYVFIFLISLWVHVYLDCGCGSHLRFWCVKFRLNWLAVWCFSGEELWFSSQKCKTYLCLGYVTDSMSVWNLLREFRIRKVHMAVVLNEYGGTVGVCT